MSPLVLIRKGDRLRFAAVGTFVVIFFSLQPLTSINVVWSSFALSFGIAALMGGIGVIYRWTGRDEGIATTSIVTAQLIVATSFLALDNYLGLAVHRPLFDPLLERWDRVIGFDWDTYVGAVKANPIVAKTLTIAYFSVLVQMIFAIAFLGLTQRLSRLDEFSLAYLIAGGVTVAWWVAFPTLGEMQWRYVTGAPAVAYSVAIGREEALQAYQLWQSGVANVRFHEMIGLVGAPSFHTVMALLSVRAFWGLPRIGVAMTALNVLVLASIPADGGHHLVDILAGGFVAWIAVLAAKQLLAAPSPRSTSGLASVPLTTAPTHQTNI